MENLKNTHVTVDNAFTLPVNQSNNTLGDNIGYVHEYDFSKANLCHENRIAAVSTVASICYQNPKAIGSINLFDRLATEASSLPSSAYEFIPVLIKSDDGRFDPSGYFDALNKPSLPSIMRYCELVYEGDDMYMLTNYRSLVYDVESGLLPASVLDIYNTEEECAIIKKHFKVYKFRVDLSTRAQMVRHRVNWQELSRRYVSGKRVPFSFYISEPMSKIELDAGYRNEDGKPITFDMEDLFHKQCIQVFGEHLCLLN